MHRVSVIVHYVTFIQYNHNRDRVLVYYLFQENKSFGTDLHLHSSSDVQEVVLSTLMVEVSCWTKLFSSIASPLFRTLEGESVRTL
jgi:hypothetical protein